MNNKYSLEGVGGVNCITLPLASATVTVIDKDYDGAKGMAVTLTGDGEIGYGAEGAAVFGVIKSVGSDGDKGLCASVQIRGAALVTIPSATAKQPAPGDAVLVAGDGKVVKVTAPASGALPTVTKAQCVSVDTAAKTAWIMIG